MKRELSHSLRANSLIALARAEGVRFHEVLSTVFLRLSDLTVQGDAGGLALLFADFS